jgi:hypothetical protein
VGFHFVTLIKLESAAHRLPRHAARIRWSSQQRIEA